MLSDPHVANIDVSSGAETTASFTRVNPGNFASEYKNFSAAAGAPSVLRVSHKKEGKKGSVRDRRLLSLECYGLDENDVEIPDVVAKINVVLDVPQGKFTTTQIDNLYRQVLGVLRGGSGDVVYDTDPTAFWNRFVNGEH
jgi:hypothetical protein